MADKDDSAHQYGAPTYHHTAGAAHPNEPQSEHYAGSRNGVRGGPERPLWERAVRGTAVQTFRAARGITRKVIHASKADGAQESGLTALIWNQVLSYGTDAMITVALASTVFFGASTSAKRGNILLYLLITMAPFAVVAPVIGPVLDRFQHGRRWAMAATGFGRALMALVMSGHPKDLLVLYPCALGSLVCSKAYSVLRAAAAPRLVPPDLNQNQVNARLTIFGLGSTIVFGGFIGIVIKITGSYGIGLFVTALAFIACGIFALRLPPQVDSAPSVRLRPTRAPAGEQTGGNRRLLYRVRTWAGRGFNETLIIALEGESALRLLSGMLTIFLAFRIEQTSHGFTAAWHLGAIAAAAGAGNFAGVAVGTRLRGGRPLGLIISCTALTAVATAIAAVDFVLGFIVLAVFVCSVTNGLAKIALDSLIQTDVAESLRSSAFSRSETFLQLAWVLGAALGVGLSAEKPTDGAWGFWIATAIIGAVAMTSFFRSRAVHHAARRGEYGPSAAPGSVTLRSPEEY